MSTPAVPPALARRLAGMLAGNLRREYPSQLSHRLFDDGDVRPPRQLTPVFFGCYDWHSAVHGHWLLARVLRLCPDVAEHDEIAGVLDEHLTPEKVDGILDSLKRGVVPRADTDRLVAEGSVG